MIHPRYLCCVVLIACSAARVQAADNYEASDSLAIKADPSADAQSCLDGLKWQLAKFKVTCAPVEGRQYDQLVRYPTPVPSGDDLNDLVAMEWYAAKNEAGELIDAPAMLVVHESGSSMPVGRLFARSLQAKGCHAFLIHLPYYGERRRGVERPKVERLVTTIQQAAADVRRGYDAIAALPHVDQRHIGLQGTSLGGFVCATAASLDGRFDNVFIMLAGGNLYDVITSGQKDAAKVRELLAEAGYTDQKLKDLLHHIEPTRVAHRLNPKTTWIYSAKHDTVVPLRNCQALADCAKLDDSHHVQVMGNHYTAIAFFPTILEHMVAQIMATVMEPVSN